MAATWTVTVTKACFTGNTLEVFGTLAGTGTYTSGGDAVSFLSDSIKASGAPDYVDISTNPTTSAGITALNWYNYVKGTTAANGLIQIFTSTSAQFSGTVPTEGIKFRAIWFNRDI